MTKNKKETKNKRTVVGEVSKVTNDNTIRVTIESKYPHPKYEKIIKRHVSYLVHNGGKAGELEVGDIVLIAEVPPVSKMKKWEVIEKVKKVK